MSLLLNNLFLLKKLVHFKVQEQMDILCLEKAGLYNIEGYLH